MTTEQLVHQIHKKRSFLCIGLDTDLEKIPEHILEEEDPLFAFNKAIIDATHNLCVGYKPNTAFYEAYGARGWESLKKTAAYIKSVDPGLFTIADAKRGDIGNTSARYARAFFEELGFDAVTVAPYMGRDSVEPFLSFDGKHTILLGLTSNDGAFDYQTRFLGDHELYKEVLRTSKQYNNAHNLMFVVGATKTEYLAEIRKIVPDHFLLVPGIGAQGGSLHEVCRHGINQQVGLLINSSRAIIYASNDMDFAEVAAEKALEIQSQMSEELDRLK
ncbi:MAG: orotidine-5'-phosphate decarboxylase [Flavobacteriaceae bacterium]